MITFGLVINFDEDEYNLSEIKQNVIDYLNCQSLEFEDYCCSIQIYSVLTKQQINEIINKFGSYIK